MASNTSALSGITAMTGMTSFLQEASDQGSQSLLAVTPADIASLSRRADNTSIHAKRSIKVMHFGASASSPAPEKKKKQKMGAGREEEEEGLKKKGRLISGYGEMMEEVGNLTQLLLIEGKEEEAVTLQKQVKTHLDVLAKAKKRLGVSMECPSLPLTEDYDWLISLICWNTERKPK